MSNSNGLNTRTMADHEKQWVRDGALATAVQSYRQRTDCSFAEAKEVVGAFRREVVGIPEKSREKTAFEKEVAYLINHQIAEYNELLATPEGQGDEGCEGALRELEFLKNRMYTLWVQYRSK